VQRVLSASRVAEIAEYARSVDAAFPTPLLLALPEGAYELKNEVELEILGEGVADIVDGQHRLQGIAQSGMADSFVIPVVFIADATEEQKALLFATINGKQTKVPASYIYDLFGVTEGRSPQKSAHEIARAINSLSESPWYKRLKMLGTKTPGSVESLSQGTFVKELLRHISTDPAEDMNLMRQGLPPLERPGCVFNTYFREEQDATILKILLNLFTGMRRVWPDQWDNPRDSVLTKTVCFSGTMMSLPELVSSGKARKDLSTDHFEQAFSRTKALLDGRALTLTSEHFPSSSASAGRFRDLIIESQGFAATT